MYVFCVETVARVDKNSAIASVAGLSSGVSMGRWAMFSVGYTVVVSSGMLFSWECLLMGSDSSGGEGRPNEIRGINL